MADEEANLAPQHATLELRVLGGASLVYNLPNQELTQVLGPGKPLALLAYLAHLPNRTATRDHVLDLLWSNQEPSMAKPALRQAIWYIRQRIGHSGIESGDGMIKLAVPLVSDADLFESAIYDTELERAVELYSGAFLPDLAIPGGAEFEHWANAERTRLETLFFRTAEVVIRSRLSKGKFQAAEALARKVHETNPVRQAGWRLLLEAITAAGDAVRASVEATELERMLAEQGVAPDPATSEAISLARRIPATDDRAAPAKTLVAELVGREREFSTILRAWGEAKHGEGCHITVTAGAGIGKTRLLNDVRMRLHASGVQVVHLRANVGERQVDYALVSSLAAALANLPGAKGVPPACAGTLVALNPSISSIYDAPAESIREADALRLRILALRELLDAVAHEQPTAILLDDLHWSDEASKQVLGGVTGDLADKPVLVVTASRPLARGPLQESAQQEITLESLSLEHVTALVSSIATLPDAEWTTSALRALRDGNGGSPLLVLESLQLALDRGSLRLSSGEWQCSDSEALIGQFEQGGALRQRVMELHPSESWILLLLSVAGMPLTTSQLARVSGRSEPALLPTMQALEQRGFVLRVNGELEPAHDEIGALSAELSPPDAYAAACGAVGRVLAEDAADDDQLLLRAGQLLASASDQDRLNEVFRKRFWNARGRGDRRPTRELAREMLGDLYSVEGSKTLYRSLPLYYRAGLTSKLRIGTAVSAFVVFLAALHVAALWPSRPPPDAIFVSYDQLTDDVDSPLAASLERERWANLDQVSLEPGNYGPEIRSVYGRVVPSPDGSQWAFGRLMPDSGEIDVFVVDMEGNERRLTNTPNDDGPWDWSPDGKKLLFTSSRWDMEEIYEAAVLDVGTGEVTRLTTSPHNESYLRWSPDGTLIGYTRRMLGASDVELCWTSLNLAPPTCVPGFSVLLGWRSESDALVVAGVGAQSRIGWFNLPRREFIALEPAIGGQGNVVASRDGNWIAAISRDSVAGRRGWIVFPVDAPSQTKPVDFYERPTENQIVALLTPGYSSVYLDRLHVVSPAAALPAGVPFLLSAIGTDVQGDRLPLLNLTWLSGDASIASVEEAGVFLPHQPGSVPVTVSAGGWREDTKDIEVAEAWFNTLFSEDWLEGWEERWSTYGAPTPLVTFGPDSIGGFWNNGDRSFASGAYTAAEWPANSGLGFEASVSTVITAAHQQKLTLSLSGWIDTARVADWDHLTGWIPGRDLSSDRTRCQVWYPDRESVLEGQLQVNGGGGPAIPVVAPVPVHNGDWHRVRLQIFPDGTCGLAINGQALARSLDRVPFDGPYRIWTEGVSIDSKMLVGPLTVWTGVRTDVDWSALDWPN